MSSEDPPEAARVEVKGTPGQEEGPRGGEAGGPGRGSGRPPGGQASKLGQEAVFALPRGSFRGGAHQPWTLTRRGHPRRGSLRAGLTRRFGGREGELQPRGLRAKAPRWGGALGAGCSQGWGLGGASAGAAGPGRGLKSPGDPGGSFREWPLGGARTPRALTQGGPSEPGCPPRTRGGGGGQAPPLRAEPWGRLWTAGGRGGQEARAAGNTGLASPGPAVHFALGARARPPRVL